MLAGGGGDPATAAGCQSLLEGLPSGEWRGGMKAYVLTSAAASASAASAAATTAAAAPSISWAGGSGAGS